MHALDNSVTYFDSCGVEQLPKYIRKFTGSKNIKGSTIATSMLRLQAYDLCGYFCIVFIDFILEGKRLLGYANLFCPNNYEKNDKIILENFS